MDEWVLSKEIYAAAHRWPLILVFILVGSLAGWGLAYFLPSPYQASAEIAVELNAYRTAEDRYAADYADAQFRNLDDYKHWQMSQLEILVRSDAYLQDTLNRLQETDPAWEKVEVPDLRDMLRAHWRNAGRWRLTAERPDPKQASQAVETWKDVIIEKTGIAVEESRSLLETELRLRALANELQTAQDRQASLPGIHAALVEWRLAAREQSVDRPLEAGERWYLQNLAARAAGPDEAWQALLERIPPEFAPAEEYRPWLDRLIAAVEEETDLLAGRSRSIEAEQAEVQARWESAIPAGQGLSATLIIDPISQDTLQVRQLRPTSQAALVGGLVGLLAWGLWVLYQITRRAYR